MCMIKTKRTKCMCMRLAHLFEFAKLPLDPAERKVGVARGRVALAQGPPLHLQERLPKLLCLV